MTQEDKELILKDLCAMSFYSVKVTVSITSFVKGQNPYTGPIELVSVNAVDMTCTVGNRYAQISGIKILDRKGELVCKPYLRPLSSMTEEEFQELHSMCPHSAFNKTNVPGWIIGISGSDYGRISRIDEISKLIDWLNKHYFDYRGLIDKGLALEAPEGMYNLKEK